LTRLASYFRLWEAIEAEAGTADLPAPLRFAQKMSADWFDPELFVALCSEDMNGALGRLAKYKHPNSSVRAFQGWTGTTPQAVRSASTKALN